MKIIDLNEDPRRHQSREVTVEGSVRATYNEPFPHFLLEDESGCLICRPKDNLPNIAGHILITGNFAIETPENCSVELPILTETNRSWVVHPTNNCQLSTCEFATNNESALAA